MVGATPFKEVHGHKPTVSHLRVFGSKDWARIPIDKIKDFQSQSSKCILVGYVEDAKAYKWMGISTSKCFIKHSVHFEEDQLCDAPPSEAQEGITTFPLPFDDDDLLHVSYSDEENQV